MNSLSHTESVNVAVRSISSGEPFEDACDDIYTTLKDAINDWCEKMNIEQGKRTDEEMMNFINEYEYDDDDTYFHIRQFTFE